LSLRDRLQAAPERIFERDAGLVAIDRDGAFDDLRFHGAPLELKAVLGSYRDSVPAKRKGQAMVINPALTTAYQGGTHGGRGPENNVC
jgi:hypothetical protein